MDLWIRSQDKRMLCKPQYIELYGDNEVHFGDVNIGYRCVATYKSKERALEVLDEIDNVKYQKTFATFMPEIFLQALNDVPKDAKEKSLKLLNTYEMPKE
ncbi:MAG: hypothetical protein HFH45_01210 [Bacilli bacterium]|jgi:hypothetical protein|nr:hypothetical protein [Bacilli bacterium]